MGSGRVDRRARAVSPRELKSMADTLRSIRDFLGDVQTEMQKVTWPDWPQLKNSTYVIIVFVIVVALIIFVMDLVVNNALELLRGILGG
jgi:preprotein translocase subunit SecE